ncbi:MAG: choice-of-anchor J domain-containing protein [Chitinophagales bacterium]|nr:choice-of-anchor J domain-containing protein [Chitinophagales bacterium]
MKKNFKYLMMLLAFLSVSITACQKDNFDEPNVTIEDPNLPVTHTIAELKALYTTLGSPLELTDDIIIQGVVIADDETGNFYKQIIIDDGTAGIAISIDANNLYTTYPVGRKIYVKCKGLYLGDYNGLIQLGGGINQDDPTEVARIVSTLIPEYIVKGPAYQDVPIIDVTMDELDDSYQNRLIRLSEVEFASYDMGQTYALPATQQSDNKDLVDCNGNLILVRTSGYCSFAGALTPTGNGTLVAIYSVFGSDAQLLLRDTTDVDMSGLTCDELYIDLLDEDFETTTTNGVINLTGWTQVQTKGTVDYIGRLYSGNRYAQITAYSSGDDSVQTWLITPSINLDATINEALSFKNQDAFQNGATLTVLISTDYTTGNNPNSATWTELPAIIDTNGPSNGFSNAFISSGIIDISAYSGDIHIGLRYDGNDPSGSANDHTTTYQIDDIKVSGKVQ